MHILVTREGKGGFSGRAFKCCAGRTRFCIAFFLIDNNHFNYPGGGGGVFTVSTMHDNWTGPTTREKPFVCTQHCLLRKYYSEVSNIDFAQECVFKTPVNHRRIGAT